MINIDRILCTLFEHSWLPVTAWEDDGVSLWYECSECGAEKYGKEET